jgi:lipid II:glycine glycyltransferase (peptidoglycan interpeptide bridge formation enzyme)
MSLRLRTITTEEHLEFIRSLPSASHMQIPAWAGVKAEWGSESLGWIDGHGRIVGSAMVLFRQVPKLKKYLAYMPEGPVIDWFTPDVDEWLQPMLAHLKSKGAFAVKMGPPVIVRRWESATIKKAIADGTAKTLSDVEAFFYDPRADELAKKLRNSGWLQDNSGGAGFGDVQPRYVFQVPLAGRTLDEVLKGFNQLWRRNIKKAEKAGVQVVLGGYEQLPIFHEIYKVTAERDKFIPRPLSYFQRMWTALNAEDPNRMKLYLAVHENEALSATTVLTVGEHVWYSYGASANHKRQVQPNNAIQWQMLQDAHAAGAGVYDLRGIGGSLDSDDHLFGLIQFKLGTGGQAAEYIGEWDFPISKLLYKAFDLYMSRR